MKQIYIEKAESELKTYLSLLNKWQKSVNLVSNTTLPDAWNRHIVDSAQLYEYIPSSAQVLVDLGSGAGFPALVLAILNQVNQGPLKSIYLIESDLKKTLFLKEVVRTLHLSVQIMNERIENITNIQSDIITARALTDLNQLLKLSHTFIKPTTMCLFLKGKNVQEEIKNCSIQCCINQIPSITDSNGVILKITEVKYD